MQCEKQQLMQEELQHYRAIEEERNKWEAHKARLIKEISELKRHLEISTDNGIVIIFDMDQPTHNLQPDASMRTTDKFTMYSSIPVIRTSTETKTLTCQCCCSSCGFHIAVMSC